MKTVSVTEFKAHCLEFLNQVAKTGESMILTKRGKPTAMVSPPPPETSKRWIPDQLEGKITIVGDIVAPLGVPWEALE
ncbi:MAG: type II toxin-antitoxin system Phd/YefM family antitoxin [Fimbriimonadaceae bacterium]